MKKIALYCTVVFGFILGCKSSSSSNPDMLSLVLQPKSNSNVTGVATFIETNGLVTFNARIVGLTPGVHAIHIHEKSDCSAADASSAGGHWNPTFKKHGKWTEPEHHKGDIGNFTADANGIGTITLTTAEWCIGCGDVNRDILGKGLIVHEKADDFTTQPTGNAGGRMACSAIIK